MDAMKRHATIDAYISSFPKSVQKILRELRSTVRAAAPDATEAISYGIPTLKLHGNLVHFAAYGKHIGFYPTSSGIRAFAKELKRYETAKGTVRFPIEKPLPLSLIRRIVIFRVKEQTK